MLSMRPVQGRGKERKETEEQGVLKYLEALRQEETSYNHWIFIRSSINIVSVVPLDILSYIMNTFLNNVSKFGMLIL